MDSNKKYGLILSEKSKTNQPTFQATRNVFGNDADSDDEPKKKLVLLRPSDNINRQSKISQEKAINEDPTVYQYDEIYDSMISKKEEKKEKSIEQKKPKYIENLMKAANKRKIENERRLERQIQKEREKEGDEFADKEVFVTSAYKQKLEELRKEEEKEKYEEYLESIGDVTKQKDLGGFYRHIYEQKLGTDKPEHNDQKLQNCDVKADNEKSDVKVTNDKIEISKKRNYRKRKSSDHKNMSEGEIDDSDEEINRCNLEEIRMSKKSKQFDANIDADSDFSIDDDSSDEENDKNKKDDVEKSAKQKETSKQETSTEKDIKPVKIGENVEEIKSKPEAPVVKKIDIWKKRTVGEVFDQALKRYYERKANRGS